MADLRKFFSVDIFGRKKAVSAETTERDFANFYGQRMALEHGSLYMSGRGIGSFKVDFDRVFVDPRIAFAANPGKVHSNPNTVKELVGKRSVWDFLRNPKYPEATAIAILGGPGYGKSALLQHLLLTMAHSRHERYGSRLFSPILLSARDFLPWMQEPAVPLANRLQAHFADAKLFPDLNPPEGFFLRALDRGDGLVLCDGLDELGDLGQRKALAAYLDRQIATYPRSRFVVTARPNGYRDAPLKQAWVLEMQAFSGEQVRRLIESFFVVAESMEPQAATGTGEDALRTRANKKAADLLQRIRVLPALSGMTVNPQVLSVIAKLHFEKNGLPQSRNELYGLICEALINCGPRAGKDGIPVSKKVLVLRAVASALMKRRLRDIKAADLCRLIAPMLSNPPDEVAAEKFLRAVRESGALLVEREVGNYRFAHQALQEYLAAVYLYEKKSTATSFEQMVDDNFWYESLILYAGLGDASALVQACLDHPKVQSLTLAQECLEEAKVLSPEVRTEVEYRLALENPSLLDKIAALEDERERVRLQKLETTRRRLAAEVRLGRRLKSLQRVDEQREIDPDFVTCAEYQLFLDDMRERGYYYQPDHWTALHFSMGTSGQPVAGLRYEDARDFCIWLSMRQGGTLRFRLPRPEEARQYSASNTSLSCWCADGEQYSLVGLTQRHEGAIRTDIERLPMLSLRPSIPLERSLNREVDSVFDHDVIKALNMQLDPALEKAVVHAIGHVRELIITRAFDLGVVISPDLDLARVLSRAGNVNQIATAIEKYNIPVALNLTNALLSESDDDESMARFCRLLTDILDAVAAETVLGVQQAQRRYMALFAEIVYRDYGNAAPAELAQKKQMQQAVLEFHGWLQLIMARSSGKLAAWEGIRLVREQGAEGAVANKQGLGLPAWAWGS